MTTAEHIINHRLFAIAIATMRACADRGVIPDLMDQATLNGLTGAVVLAAMPSLPALPRPPQPTAAAIVTMIEAHLASRWVRIGSKKIPYDAPGTSLLERAWKWMLAQDREMMASIYPPQPTSTKAEP